jgi:predicted nucleic acid-binding protein
MHFSGSRGTWAEPIYLDASALVKLFVSEPESEALNQALVGAEDVILSDLALTEMASALGRRTREGRLAVVESRRLYREAEKLAAWRVIERDLPVLKAAVIGLL